MGASITVARPGPSHEIPAGYVSEFQDMGYKTIWSDLGLPKEVQEGESGLTRGAADFMKVAKEIEKVLGDEAPSVLVDDDDIGSVFHFVTRLAKWCGTAGKTVRLVLSP